MRPNHSRDTDGPLRQLTADEARLLAFLLAGDDPRLVSLRQQAEATAVAGSCGCGCPSVRLQVDKEQAIRAAGLGRPAVTSVTIDDEPPEDTLWLDLWVEDGWLEYLEISWIDAPPRAVPPPSRFQPPQVSEPPTALVPTASDGAFPMDEDSTAAELGTVIDAICRMPIDIQAGNVSPSELVSRSGYRQARPMLIPEALTPTLRAHPEWTDAWFTWSDDKRTGSGWYLQEAGERFVVGYYPPTSHLPNLTFDERVEATAAFIIRELDEISTTVLDRVRSWVGNRTKR